MQIFTVARPPAGTNAFLVVAGQEAIVIDPSPGSAQQLLTAAKKAHARITMIINTHGHWDHIADNHALHHATKAPIACHRSDENMLLRPDAMGLDLVIEPTRAEQYLWEGGVVAVGGETFRIIHTPGHTPGSICLHNEQERVLISGDTLFAGTYGRTDFPGGDEEALRTSLRRLAQLPEATRVLPGHGAETTIAKEKVWMERF